MTMEIFHFLFGWWWFARDGRTKTADSADHYVTPLLLALLVACLAGLLVVVMR
jgi:hypothetical protein